jgi:hypothetical protein
VERRVELAILLCFFLIALFLCVFPIINYDLGFHLKAGELIWTQGSIPDHDPFSYTASGNRWVDSHWLFQLILYGAHTALGLPGLVLLRAVLVIATFAFVLATCWRREYLLVSIAIGLLSVFSCFGRFVMRPELFTLLFLAVFFYLAENAPRFPRRALVGIFICQLIWVNLHGLHVLGVAFLALYLLGDGLQYLANRYEPRIWAGGVTVPRLRQLSVLVALASVTLLLNGNGLDGILYPFALFRELRAEVSWYPLLAELEPTIDWFRPVIPDPVLTYFVLIGVSGFSWLGNWRRLRLAHALPYFVFLYLSLLAVRNVPLFVIVAAPITVRNLGDLLDRAGHSIRLPAWARKARQPATYVCALGLVMIAFSIANGSLYRRLGWPDRKFTIAETDRFPVEIVERLRTLEGNVWNSSNLGGYLIWKLWPEKRVALDGRWEVYGELLPMLKGVYGRPRVFDRLVHRYEIRAVVLSKGNLEARSMFPWLHRRRDWRLTIHGPRAYLFERVADRHEPGSPPEALPR